MLKYFADPANRVGMFLIVGLVVLMYKVYKSSKK